MPTSKTLAQQRRLFSIIAVVGFCLLTNAGKGDDKETADVYLLPRAATGGPTSHGPAEADEKVLAATDHVSAGVHAPLSVVRRESALEAEFHAGIPYQDLRSIRPIEEFQFSLPESVCHPDERLPIADATQAPYNANCLLLITLPDGSKARGTGWLMNGTTVVTAGHCVHDGDGGSFFPQIEVIPGAYIARVGGSDILKRRNGSQSVGADSLRASEAWKSSGTMSLDYGAILLPQVFVGAHGSPSSLTPEVMVDDDLTQAILYLAGYPGDKPTGTQWSNYGPVSTVESARLKYMIDTAGGQSGSAVYVNGPQGIRVVGIHNYAGCPNKCTRISDSVLSDLNSWMGRDLAPEARPVSHAANATAVAPVVFQGAAAEQKQLTRPGKESVSEELARTHRFEHSASWSKPSSESHQWSYDGACRECLAEIEHRHGVDWKVTDVEFEDKGRSTNTSTDWRGRRKWRCTHTVVARYKIVHRGRESQEADVVLSRQQITFKMQNPDYNRASTSD